MSGLKAWRVFDGESWVPAYAATSWQARQFHPNLGGEVKLGDMRVTRMPALDGVGGPPRELIAVFKPCPGDHGPADSFCGDRWCWEGETINWPATIARN